MQTEKKTKQSPNGKYKMQKYKMLRNLLVPAKAPVAKISWV